MPILNRNDVNKREPAPGVEMLDLVNGDLGAQSLSVGELTVAEGMNVPTHIHPTEEAMVILEGDLHAVLGEEVISVTSGQTVLAPAGVKHGFMNRSGSSARVMAIFPTSNVERTIVD